ncbi:MAG: TIGR00730 family Rossman fold protein [Alphaproteobacteria bacterium]|nr:TIGR00730 family Rossman fold protein [Alphaproteobacteria bacterium]
MAERLRTIAVYCGHQFGKNPNFKRDAAAVGRMLAKNGIRMVFGGGDVGLMGTVATSALKYGGHVMGVSTDDVIAMQEPAHDEIDVQVVDGVNERKQIMFDESDAFIILPGGIGTLNELTDILTMQQIGETNKPLFFLNTDGFWNPLARLLKHMQKNGFIVRTDAYNIFSAETVAELKQQVLKY